MQLNYSNPIDAGLNTFMRTLNIMDAVEDRPIKRRLLQKEVANKEAQMEHEAAMRPLQLRQATQGLDAQKIAMETQKTQQEVQRRQMEREQEGQFKTELVNNLNSVLMKPQDQRTDDDHATVMLAAQQMKLGEKPENILKTGKMLTALRSKFTAMMPKVQEAITKGQKVRIDDPEIVEGVGAIPGIAGELTKGTDKYGQQAVQKKLKSLLVDEKGNVSFVLEVIAKNPQSGELETYEAPITFGRTADPNGRIVQIPYQLLAAKADISEKMINNEIIPMMTQMGADSFVQKWRDTENGMKELQSFGAGAQAMKDMISVNPKADQNDLRIAAQAAVLKKAQDLGVKIDIKKLDDYLKTVAPEKDAKKGLHTVGRALVTDEGKVVYRDPKDGGGGGGDGDEENRLKGYEVTGIEKQVGRAFMDQALNNVTDEDIKSKVTPSNAFNYLTKEQRLLYRGVIDDAQKLKKGNAKMTDSESVQESLRRFQSGGGEKPKETKAAAPKDGEVKTGPDGNKYKWNAKEKSWYKFVRPKMNLDKYSKVMGANTGGM